MGRRVITQGEVVRPLADGGGPQGPEPDSYLSRLVKYIPAEVVAVYLAVVGILATDARVPIEAFWVVFVLVAIATPFYIWRVTRDPKKPTPTSQIAVSFGSFIVWAFSLGQPFASLSWYLPVYGGAAVALYTFLIPALVGR